ncbi:MAG TPA: Mu transposase C-terminal domain-containing protein [Desulfatiglandales bacterium]|nr:Mu transposase C-terminal domain-containing protein [Desulfatiglandales bacterium]
MHRNRKYITVQEFAKYEGVAVKTIKRWVKSGKISIIKSKGKNKYRNSQNYIHYTQLSDIEAQEEFIQDRGLASKEKSGAPKAEDQQYLGLTAKQKSRLNQNTQIIKTFLSACQNLPPGKLTSFTRQFAKTHKMSESKLRRITKKYIKDGIESLIPRWNPGIQKRKFETDKETVRFIEKTYMIELGPSIQETYQRYCEEFRDKRDLLFSHTTLANFINRNWSESERLLARNPDEWKKHHGIYVNRDWNKVLLNEVWFSDSKQIDIACLYNKKVIFPWLTAFMDAKSRKFTGWVLTATPDKWAINQAFDYGIATHGVPKVIYIDRGKPYKSYHISGGKLTTGKVINLFEDIENEPFIGLFREAGCDVFFAYPRNAKEKIIEAAFGIFTNRLNYLPGWRSHDTKHRPRKLEREIKQKKIPSFTELYREINKVIEERNSKPHSTTKRVPNDFYKDFTPIIPSEAFRAFLKMDRHFVKIRNGGVRIKADFYRGKELWRHSGEEVEVRRDPGDILKAAVIQGNTLLEIAYLEPAGHYRSPITLKNRETVAKLNQNIRRERKRLIAHEEEILANPDPLKVAMEMGGEELKLKPREIRPASKVTSLHKNEKLSRQVMKELEKSEPEIDIESEAATASKESIFTRYANISKRKKEPTKPPLRLIPRERLTMYNNLDEN